MSIERWLEPLGAALVVALVRGTLAFLLAFSATALVRKLSHETRHLIWLGVVVSFLIIPLAWLTLPALRVGRWIQLEEAAAHRTMAVPLLARQEYLRFADGAREYARLTRQQLPPHLRLLPPALLLAWLLGVLFQASRLLAGRCRLRRLTAAAVRDSRLRRLAEGLAGKGLARGKLAVLRSAHCSVPFTFGLFRPVIMLPRGAAAWPPGRLHTALLHELGHIRRRDALVQSIAYVICLLFWFIPPLWLAYAALLRESESCCDQQVINGGFRGSEYARDLLDLASNSAGRFLLPSLTGAAGKKGMLQARIRNLLSLKPGRPPFGFRGARRVLVVFLCCLVPLLSFTFDTKPSLVETDDSAFGTWINPAYDGERIRPGKCILFPDGRELDYAYIDYTQPYREARNVIQEAWIDANGDRWYKVRSQGSGYPFTRALAELWAIQRISNGGKIFEMVVSFKDYPVDLSPTPGEVEMFGIWYKQE